MRGLRNEMDRIARPAKGLCGKKHDLSLKNVGEGRKR